MISGLLIPLIISFTLFRDGINLLGIILVVGSIAAFVFVGLFLRPTNNHRRSQGSVSFRKTCYGRISIGILTSLHGVEPVVNRLETSLSGKLSLIKINVKDHVAPVLANQLQLEATPTFILFDSSGDE